MTEQSIGQRVAAARKLANLTQQQLAERAHVSMSLVSQVERGSKPASSGFVGAVAHALGVGADHLNGTEHVAVVGQPSDESASLAELRRALDSHDDPRPDGQPLTLAVATERAADLSRRLRGLRYTETAREIPALLHHLYVLADRDGVAGEQGRALLHDGYRMAASVAGQFRQADVAALASERHIQLAPSTGEPRRIAISAFHRSTRYLRHGDYRSGLRMLGRARAHLGTDRVDLAVAVQLDLRSAVLAARAGDGREADEYLSEAKALIEQFSPPERPVHGIDASATNVLVHWCALPVEQYDGTESVRRSTLVRVEDRARPERVAHHHIDMARAYLLHGDRGEALVQLNTARAIAPHNTRFHPQVHETVRGIAEQGRRRDDTLAGFARWAGIQV
ncbi:helix-turn-helix domain-containing protein [Prauserella cavernicola]|uniref:Helix-turn-helix transcriptional regulator n=1 Tax=Prauserella cavernicola TaxID=2800127 RepID=A0A934V406_9PSEU|nr:helix-turn-helix transcriptional regulator [Prauserella cavernicola]MBK1783610.1 helix-turn-helix transcriptional regulator [Prauserella cavernicola]